MRDSLQIKFLSRDEFLVLRGVHKDSLVKKPNELDDPNIVQGFSLKESVHKSSEDRVDLDPSYTCQAQACTAGFLMINGANLHSHMVLHANGAKANYSDQTEIDPIQEALEEFPKRLNEFFDQLDSLIRAGKLKGQTISIDTVLAGSTERFQGNHPKIGDVVKTSKAVRDSMIEMLNSRISNIQRLADEHDVTIEVSQSKLLNQEITVRPELGKNAGEISATHLHYDPEKNILSINADYGIKESENLHITETLSTNTNGQGISNHYAEIELGPNHIAPEIRSALNHRDIQASFQKLSSSDQKANAAKYKSENLWQARLNRPSYPYEMNSGFNNCRLCTGIGNGEVYCAVSDDSGKWTAIAMNENGDIRKLNDDELPQLPSDFAQVTNTDYYYAEPRKRESAYSGPVINEADAIERISQAIEDTDQGLAFYTGAGISIDSGIAGMANYKEAIWGKAQGAESESDFDDLSQRLNDSPETIMKAIEGFFKSFEFAKPSPAHNAIAELSVQAGQPIPVFTENHDSLHQKTGIRVIATPKLKTEEVKASLDEDAIKKLNYLVCSGLSHDDRGLISYLKEINPNLIIIANALEAPEFLLNDDPNNFFLPGDIQEILPKLITQPEQ